jgi:hypothetical protein
MPICIPERLTPETSGAADDDTVLVRQPPVKPMLMNDNGR